jgi:hypothetical protein
MKMTKTKPESDFILVRREKPDFNNPEHTIMFSIERNNEKTDLTDLVYLKTQDNGIEEWVHKDVYQFYYDLMHKYDNIKECVGSEDHKDFLEGMS